MAVERGVVKPSKFQEVGGDSRMNGFMSLAGGAPTVEPSKFQDVDGDSRMGSFPLTESASPISPPDHRFNVGQVQMPQPGSAIEPGKGAVPVNPFLAGGAAARSLPVADMAGGAVRK
jgi:hypothetical protein